MILNTSDLYNTFLKAASLSKSSETYETRKPKNFVRLPDELKILLNNKTEARTVLLEKSQITRTKYNQLKKLVAEEVLANTRQTLENKCIDLSKYKVGE